MDKQRTPPPTVDTTACRRRRVRHLRVVVINVALVMVATAVAITLLQGCWLGMAPGDCLCSG